MSSSLILASFAQIGLVYNRVGKGRTNVANFITFCPNHASVEMGEHHLQQMQLVDENATYGT